ncbi:acyl-coenzyme A diphosphatase FITM2 isoform X2 [Microcaecilia unicolor]|uniref:Fat storage-inducing transmembrane protein 2 isoform X2 n=1 Tax=Microcaecilia unicolor TaxID=1415580 RepID=A0A6P7YP11_9AMPH|nr:fat storage-inducing transmembrane protein 2 isoform X2 [Microcaecilia unicolor]
MEIKVRTQVGNFLIKCLESCTQFLKTYCLTMALRQRLYLVLLCITVIGSLFKELLPLPDSYLNNKRNFLNVYFVKVAWAWTFWLLLPFIAITTFYLTRNQKEVLRRLSTLLIGTIIWYVCTRFFMFIENLTGSCYTSEALQDLKEEHENKKACVMGGGVWYGFDISGHSFLLPYCILMIVEETAVVHELKLQKNQYIHIIVSALFVALGILALIWVWMFFCTAIYFHDIYQKLFGTAFGLLAWYGTYQAWYLHPISPGRPPQGSYLKSKQHSYRL